MLGQNEWWNVMGTYYDAIFPLQWIGLLIMVGMTGLLMMGEEKSANVVIKGTLSLMNLFIGVRFFFMSLGFPLPLRIAQGLLFISIGLLMGMDVKWNRLHFQFPKDGWKRAFFLVGLVVMALYPFVGSLFERAMNHAIVPGTFPCPTTAYALMLFITAKKRDNRLLFFLLLVWAVPFPPLVQIPKYQVYEDGIMFILGLIGLVFFIRDMMGARVSKTSGQETVRVNRA